MQKKYTWHFVAWGIYALYQYMELYFEKEFLFHYIALTTSYITTVIATFYFFYFLIWKPFLQATNTRWRFLVLVPLGIVFFIALRYTIEENIFEWLLGFGNYRNDDLYWYSLDNVWRAFFYGTASLIVALLEQKNDFAQKYLQLKNEKSEAELAFLRSQLNPHFIFNTLSYLHTKTYKLDPGLSQTVLKLSDMLRYSLQSSKQDKVPVKNEIELLENYIAIFQNRFDGKFFVTFDVSGTGLHQRIEPLLLIPFVENMFKHGIVNQENSPASIKIQVLTGKLEFICQNKINQHQKDPGSGIGLENVKRRLDLLYPGQYDLQIRNEAGLFYVKLLVDLS